MKHIETNVRRIIMVLAVVTAIASAAAQTANAAFVETYTGSQDVIGGQSFNFGFDLLEDNFDSGVGSDSALTVPLALDAVGAPAFWSSATLTVNLFADDPVTTETVQIHLQPWNFIGDVEAIYLVGNFVFDPAPPGWTHIFTHTFTPLQLDQFSLFSWGNVIISAPDIQGVVNDFTITEVSMEVQPVPVPAAILLFTSGLIGFAGFGRKLGG